MTDHKSKKIDAVFEGGGVKGSAFAGAIAVTEEQGYTFENLAGTSAGSLVAALVAAGYKADRIHEIMNEVDYTKFKDETFIDKIPLIGKGLNLLLKDGIYKGDYVEEWIESLLAQKGIKTFADLVIPEYANDPKFRYKLQAIASDITNNRFVVLPGDATNYGIDPDNLSVARALRMSISIPFFFEPVIWGQVPSYILDGGLLSSFPVWLLDDGTNNPPWPTIGYKLVDPAAGQPNKIDGPIKFLSAMFNTMTRAHDQRYIDDHDFARTVPIPTLDIQGTDFDITTEQKEALYQSGRQAAEKFFANWNFEEYKQKYRLDAPTSRTERIWKKK